MKPYRETVSADNPLGPQTADLGTTIRSGKVAFKLGVARQRSGSTAGEPPSPDTDRRHVWMQAYITNFTMTMSVGEVLSADITFESDGAAVENKFTVY